MAAADSSTVATYIPILVATLPVILSPIVAWALGRSKVSKEAAMIDYLSKRLDILERLNKLHTQLAEGPIRPFLDTEIGHCRTFLHQRPGFIPYDAEVFIPYDAEVATGSAGKPGGQAPVGVPSAEYRTRVQ